MGLMDIPIKLALNKAKESYINPQLEGIGTLEDLVWKDGAIHGTLLLVDMEDQPIEVEASNIKIAPDASSISIGSLRSNKRFVANGLKRFVEGKEFPIPEGAPRTAALAAKKLLRL